MHYLPMLPDYFSNPRVPGTLKRFLYFPWLYRQGEHKNILLFSTRRSGSTLLAQLISSNPGIRYVDQPFNCFGWTGQKIRDRYLSSVSQKQLINLSEKEALLVKKYMSLILEGRLKQLGGLERFEFPFLSNRVLVKICNGLPLINWFNTNFDVLTCYLVRHPIPQALSVMRNKWGITAKAYIDDESFVECYLNINQLKLAQKILSQGTYFQQSILNWCLDNLVPLKYDKSTLLKITYEEVILNPAYSINLIAEKLDLKDPEEMLRRIAKPSKSSYLSEQETRKSIFEGDREKLVSKWKSQVTNKQIDDAKEILEVFEFFEYRADEYLPAYMEDTAKSAPSR